MLTHINLLTIQGYEKCMTNLWYILSKICQFWQTKICHKIESDAIKSKEGEAQVQQGRYDCDWPTAATWQMNYGRFTVDIAVMIKCIHVTICYALNMLSFNDLLYFAVYMNVFIHLLVLFILIKILTV